MPSASTLPAEVSAWLDDPGFTPGARHLQALFAALATAERDEARKLERVLARAGEIAGRFALARLSNADARERARSLAVLGRIVIDHDAPEFRAALSSALDDADERVRRIATSALAKSGSPELEARLLARWPEAGPPEKRSLAEALGKCGGERTLGLLAELKSDDRELARIVERSRLMIERDRARTERSEIALDSALSEPHSLLLHCRSGLAWVLVEEARALGAATTIAPDCVRLTHRGTFAELLALRTALDFGLEWPLAGSTTDSLEARIVETLAQPGVERAVSAWTRGRARFRLAFAEGGHRREKVWAVASAIHDRLGWLHNDPQDSTWEVSVDQRRSRLAFKPRRFTDPRFAYRAKDVRAASHPTLAAALARVAGVRSDDVVWDPFVGSGLELIERAKLGAYRELHGTDLDPNALGAARENAARAGIERIHLFQSDALATRIAGLSLIISNPPMGRRVARDGSLPALLERFVEHARSVLVRNGRMVWLSPLPARTAAVAERAGFRVSRHDAVDLGGFSAELQIFTH
ncbi:MAG TPA: methyltransferase [Polyangiaceae bacterium]|nr:methyltransferase [Polyangiaceae bacterium]